MRRDDQFFRLSARFYAACEQAGGHARRAVTQASCSRLDRFRGGARHHRCRTSFSLSSFGRSGTSVTKRIIHETALPNRLARRRAGPVHRLDAGARRQHRDRPLVNKGLVGVGRIPAASATSSARRSARAPAWRSTRLAGRMTPAATRARSGCCRIAATMSPAPPTTGRASTRSASSSRRRTRVGPLPARNRPKSRRRLPTPCF